MFDSDASTTRENLRHEVFLNMAAEIARLGTCARRKVGAVALDIHGRVLGMAYNGAPKDFGHCIEQPCMAAGSVSGTDLDRCEAIHAETNLIAFCPDIMRIHTVYLTCSPCRNCVKTLANTACQHIIFREEYPHGDAKAFWLRAAGRTWTQID